MPPVASTYVVRLFANDTMTQLAESALITANLTMTGSGTTAAPGSTVTTTIANGPATSGDWIGLYPIGTATLVDWKYLNGSRTAPPTGLGSAVVPFTMPMVAGTYVFKFFANNSGAAMATSAPIVVSAPPVLSFTVSSTNVAPGNVVSATIANGPGNAADWVALFPAGSSTWLDW